MRKSRLTTRLADSRTLPPKNDPTSPKSREKRSFQLGAREGEHLFPATRSLIPPPRSGSTHERQRRSIRASDLPRHRPRAESWARVLSLLSFRLAFCSRFLFFFRRAHWRLRFLSIIKDEARPCLGMPAVAVAVAVHRRQRRSDD